MTATDRVYLNDVIRNATHIGSGIPGRTLAVPGYMVNAKLSPDVWRALNEYAHRERQKPETIIAEAVSAYLGLGQ